MAMAGEIAELFERLSRSDFRSRFALGCKEREYLVAKGWYTILSHASDAGLQVEFVPIAYDFCRLANEMDDEGLPKEFSETIRTGWWTTCLEVLPAKERRRGRY